MSEDAAQGHMPPQPQIREEPLAEVLVEVPDDVRRRLKEIIDQRHQGSRPLGAEILDLVPEKVLLDIMRSDPDSQFKIIECLNRDECGNLKHVRFAKWIKRGVMPKGLDKLKWQEIMGDVFDQKQHDICWSIVVTELIRALILIERPNTDSCLKFSCQDLIDFTNPTERKKCKRSVHYCYTSSINRGMRYIMKRGIMREADRKFIGCPPDFPDRFISRPLGFIKDFARLESIDEVLSQLRYRPIGAAVAMFLPDYKWIGGKIYRGPMLRESKLVGLHAVSLVSAGEENGERYVRARASHGREYGVDGCLKISIDVIIAYLRTPDEEIDVLADKYFSKPTPLLQRFSYPRLLSLEEEEKKRKTVNEAIS